MFAEVLLLAVLVVSGQCVKFIVRNNEVGPILVGTLGNAGKAPLANGGFLLEAHTETVLSAPDDWAGRFWARTWCNLETFFCETGSCGSRLECAGSGGAPPATLAEITLRGGGGLDYYDISLVDGFNLKASIEAVDGRGVDGPCKKAACDYYINDECPAELRLIGPAGGPIACKSACLAFNTDQYCCRGVYGVPEKCRPTDWPTNWADFFKKRCPGAYSYAYDDATSTFTCIADTYRITFG